MSNLLLQIADRVVNQPLMITPDKLAIISSVLERRIGIDASEFKLDEASLLAVPEASRFEGEYEPSAHPADKRTGVKPYRTSNGVAIIPVMGSLVNRGAWIGASSGLTSYEGLKLQINRAAADQSVTSILLDINSPGGEAIGCFEVGEAVAVAGKIKPVIASVNGMMCSAAYALACSATKIITTTSGMSGSIGVVMLHLDYSQKLHDAGIKPTLIHAGARKVDGSPYVPLTDVVKGELKSGIENFMNLFVDAVAQGRKGMTPESIRATEARTFIGQAAVDAGLADEVGSFETALAALSKPKRSSPNPTRRSSMEDAKFTQAELDKAVADAKTAGITEGKAAGHKEGAEAERVRISAILGSEEAKGREASALHLATKTGMSAEDANGVLVGVAAAKPDAARPKLALASRGDLGITVDANGGKPTKPTASVNATEIYAGRRAK